MSRHSKWAKIKRQKNVTDVKRGQLFTKLLRTVSVVARESGGDPTSNVRLRMAIDRALEENMPKDTIQRAIDRATGAGDETPMQSLVVEGYGPGGAALLIEAVTDNRNRTVGDIRKILAAAGGSLGSAGSTQWMFERRGRILLRNLPDPDKAELVAIDAGALDLHHDGTSLEIFTSADTLHVVASALESAGYTPQSRTLTIFPATPREIPDHAFAQLQTVLDDLLEHADIVDVVTNAVPDEKP